MADNTEVVNAGEQITTAPSALPLKPDEQFRLINQRLDKLVGEFEKIAKPPQFRLVDVLGLIAIVIGFGVTAFGAFGLSERIADVSKHQADTETRLDASMNAMELRLGTRLDKLGDQFSSMDERTSRLEGEKAAKPEKPQ